MGHDTGPGPALTRVDRAPGWRPQFSVRRPSGQTSCVSPVVSAPRANLTWSFFPSRFFAVIQTWPAFTLPALNGRASRSENRLCASTRFSPLSKWGDDCREVGRRARGHVLGLDLEQRPPRLVRHGDVERRLDDPDLADVAHGRPPSHAEAARTATATITVYRVRTVSSGRAAAPIRRPGPARMRATRRRDCRPAGPRSQAAPACSSQRPPDAERLTGRLRCTPAP